MHIVVTVGALVCGMSRVQYFSCTPPCSLNNLSTTKAFQMYPALSSSVMYHNSTTEYVELNS